MYQKVSTDLNFIGREEEVLSFWEKEEIFKKAQKAAEGRPEFTFYDGPPTANGKPHIGHILTRCIKDLFPRYKAMQGYNVLRKAGWDTHGLPVELEVEKLLQLDGKEQIEQYGVEPFIQKCKESVWKYKGEWEEMSRRVGYWADMENPYITYDNNYIESVWWSLKQIHEKGLLYKGHKIVPYCPRCGTALSSHEVAQGYQDVTERSATAIFKCTDDDAAYLAWTTTPWTLPSNVCLCVNANVQYAKAVKDGKAYILAKDLVEQVLGEGAEIVQTYLGSELVGRSYEPLFECTAKACEGQGKAHYIIADDYVTTTDGTGIVHNAPAFGPFAPAGSEAVLRANPSAAETLCRRPLSARAKPLRKAARTDLPALPFPALCIRPGFPSAPASPFCTALFLPLQALCAEGWRSPGKIPGKRFCRPPAVHRTAAFPETPAHYSVL